MLIESDKRLIAVNATPIHELVSTSSVMIADDAEGRIAVVKVHAFQFPVACETGRHVSMITMVSHAYVGAILPIVCARRGEIRLSKRGSPFADELASTFHSTHNATDRDIDGSPAKIRISIDQSYAAMVRAAAGTAAAAMPARLAQVRASLQQYLSSDGRGNNFVKCPRRPFCV